MFRSIHGLLALWLCSSLCWAQGTPAPASSERTCVGMANEVTKGRELNRELNAYAGQTVPDDLQQRVMKHLTLVARLKAECDSTREQPATRK